MFRRLQRVRPDALCEDCVMLQQAAFFEGPMFFSRAAARLVEHARNGVNYAAAAAAEGTQKTSPFAKTAHAILAS